MSVSPEDLAHARRAARDAKSLARRAATHWTARMDPQPIPRDQSAALARAIEDLAYHVGWMARALEDKVTS